MNWTRRAEKRGKREERGENSRVEERREERREEIIGRRTGPCASKKGWYRVDSSTVVQ